MIWLILIYFTNFIILSESRFEPQDGVIRLNYTMLKSWYDDLSICMINDETSLHNVSYWKVLEDCKKNVKGEFQDGFFSLPSSAYANKVRGCCCTEDIPLKERGFDWVLKGHEDGNVTPVIDLMNLLSHWNMSLLFLGDSMDNQVFTAMLAELRREDKKQEGVFDYNIKSTIPWFQNPESLGMTRKAANYLNSVFTWTPKKTTDKEPNRVFVYKVDLWYFNNNFEEIQVKDKLIPQIVLRDHQDGVVISANIGHHLASERSSSDPTQLDTHMSHFLNWLHDLWKVNPNNLPLFRETTPSHFNSPDMDGSFEKWHASPNVHYNWEAPNDWDQSLYYCRAIENYSSPSQQLPENAVALRLLKAWGPSSHVHTLHTFSSLAPFYSMKYGNCGGWTRIDVIDCVHFCSWSPPMWIPIWKDLLGLVRHALNNLVGDEERKHPDALYGPLPLVGIVDHIELSEASLIQYAPTPTHSPHQQQGEEGEEDQLFLLYHGLRRRVVGGLEAFTSALHQTLDETTVYRVSLSSMLSIPQGFPFDPTQAFAPSNPLNPHPKKDYPDGSLVKLMGHRNREIWYMAGGKRCSIPNWDTFNAMKLQQDKVIELDQAELDLIPLGETLPPLDSP